MADDSLDRMRARAFVSEQFTLLVVVVLVAAAVGGWVTYDTHVDQEPVTERRQSNLVVASGGFDHQATVQESSGAFSAGQTLSDQPLYFTAVAPVLNGTYRFSYRSPADPDLSVDTFVLLTIREVGEGQVYWQTNERLDTSTFDTVPPGRTARTPFEINVSTVDQRADRIRSELGASPGDLELIVVARTRLEGTVQGREIQRVLTTRMTIASNGDTYRVRSKETTTSVTETETVTVEPSPPLYRVVGGPALLGVGLLLAAGLVAGRSTRAFELSEDEHHALERAEFDEWISPGTVPEAPEGTIDIAVESLPALVDVAIDTNGRVIEDREAGQYVVLDADTRYTFTPDHRTPVAPWERALAETDPGRGSDGAATDGTAGGGGESGAGVGAGEANSRPDDGDGEGPAGPSGTAGGGSGRSTAGSTGAGSGAENGGATPDEGDGEVPDGGRGTEHEADEETNGGRWPRDGRQDRGATDAGDGVSE